MNAITRLTLSISMILSISLSIAQNRVATNFDVNQISQKIDGLLENYSPLEPGVSIGTLKDNKYIIAKH
jgi:hypothetical protein